MASQPADSVDAFGVPTKPKKKKASSPTRPTATLDEEGGVAYLRPETAQGVYVQFANIANSMRARIPFGKAPGTTVVNSGRAAPGQRTPFVGEKKVLAVLLFYHRCGASREVVPKRD